ncbi:MAG: hypothetical protein KGJ28_04195 [Alphaproteobacteria bacterium]|nr:hypothetical protein [Alphaproteobacteria bacterium]
MGSGIKSMQSVSRALVVALLTGASALATAQTAYAAQSAPNTADAKIEALEGQVKDLSAQVQDLKRSTGNEYTDLQKQQTSATKVTITNGRPTIASADGDFTASVRALVQLDLAYYGQTAAATSLPASYGPDLSSGANFRRAQLGLQGKVFGDWSYLFNYEFGGSGGSKSTNHIQSVYLQYDGLAPLVLRVGAFATPANVEDGTSSGDTIFLERNSPSNLQRGLAGGDGRYSATLLYAGDRLFGALSYTGAKLSDNSDFDAQQAVVGRVSDLVYVSSNARLLLGLNGTYIVKLADAVASGGPTLATTPGATALNSVTLSDTPELTVDSNGIKLANTGSMPANHISQWGVETAGNWKNFYVQSGYFDFEVDRASTAYKSYSSASTTATTIIRPNNDQFSGWYVQTSWVLTGESKSYSAANGAFTPPRPATPFTMLQRGWGAWELAARYSDLNLNDHVLDPAYVITNWTGASTKTYTFYNTVRGGDQRIATVGLNWYPNNGVRFTLDYQWTDVNRLQIPVAVTTTGMPTLPTLNGGQNIQTIAMRFQIGF